MPAGLCRITWSEAVKLLLYGLLCGLQHQVPDVQYLDRRHGILIHLHLRLRPVHGDGVTPQLNPTWQRDRTGRFHLVFIVFVYERDAVTRCGLQVPLEIIRNGKLGHTEHMNLCFWVRVLFIFCCIHKMEFLKYCQSSGQRLKVLHAIKTACGTTLLPPGCRA